MMTGSVLGRHALLPITFHLPNQPDIAIEFVVDTGFTYYLTLPPAAVMAMGLLFLHRVPADLADDTTIEIDVHAGTILWNGAERDVRVLSMGRRPLLGTALLDGYELNARFIDGGTVRVNNL